mmetsp:Transcript_25501/g.33320  ORF Transcript_25501/g.33320 Transcript_25501/m.33320 type:complete len:129 (+) Transcript_25501:89-475(+)
MKNIFQNNDVTKLMEDFENAQLDKLPFKDLACFPLPLAETEVNLALSLFIVNIIFSGVGTIICGVYRKSWKVTVIGTIQFLTTGIFLAGWVWSIWWGYYLHRGTVELKKAKETKEKSSFFSRFFASNP